MRTGQVVTYVDAQGHGSDAVVLAVVGAGASGAKQLDLAVGDTRLTAVSHADDAASAVGNQPVNCWTVRADAAPDVSRAEIDQVLLPQLAAPAPAVESTPAAAPTWTAPVVEEPSASSTS